MAKMNLILWWCHGYGCEKQWSPKSVMSEQSLKNYRCDLKKLTKDLVIEKL